MLKRYWGTVKQFLQFNIIGILNTAVDFLVFTALTELLGVVYLLAKTISYTCGVLNSYLLNSAWTFKRERRRTGREFLLFLCVNLVSLGASLLVMYLCRSVAKIESDFICNMIATPISMMINFAGNKLLVFKKQD